MKVYKCDIVKKGKFYTQPKIIRFLFKLFNEFCVHVSNIIPLSDPNVTVINLTPIANSFSE